MPSKSRLGNWILGLMPRPAEDFRSRSQNDSLRTDLGLLSTPKGGASVVPYIKIARLDHWFKNVFLLPGAAVVVFQQPELWDMLFVGRLTLAVLVAGIIASSNYVLNEVRDGPQDAHHPVKKDRPVPSGKVNARVAYVEWLALAIVGLALSLLFGGWFFVVALAFWCMGCVYNAPPARSKEIPYLDVLSESANNPLRLLLGWYATGTSLAPSLSLVLAWWMLGAFFMAVKRFAEYRKIDNPERAARYRRSFAYYNEERLLVSITYYAVAFGMFLGIFIIRYHMELLLAVPFIAGFIAYYIHLGYMKDSPVQYPERLYKRTLFMAYIGFCVFVLIALIFVDIPALNEAFGPSLPVHETF